MSNVIPFQRRDPFADTARVEWRTLAIEREEFGAGGFRVSLWRGEPHQSDHRFLADFRTKKEARDHARASSIALGVPDIVDLTSEAPSAEWPDEPFGGSAA